MNIIPECYFDTVLVKTLLKCERVNHQKSCFKVESSIRCIDDFAVGIIDKDKREILYLKEFIREIATDSLILWKHWTKQHYFIQLAPAIETWILQVAKESNISPIEFGLPDKLEELKKYTKTKAAENDPRLISFCKTLANSKSDTIKVLTLWLEHLYTHHRNADINILKHG